VLLNFAHGGRWLQDADVEISSRRRVDFPHFRPFSSCTLIDEVYDRVYLVRCEDVHCECTARAGCAGLVLSAPAAANAGQPLHERSRRAVLMPLAGGVRRQGIEKGV
jgi:hypothetical protein